MKKRTVGVLLAAFFAMALTGCGDKQPQPGEVKGYDKGEEYLSIWVHSIEDTEEGQCYRKSVDAFNKKYDGKYFADIEFIPRNDSGGGYSDKINASVMSGDLPDVLTVDGPNIAAYTAEGCRKVGFTLEAPQAGQIGIEDGWIVDRKIGRAHV